MNGWKDGWSDGQLDVWVDEWVGQIDGTREYLVNMSQAFVSQFRKKRREKIQQIVKEEWKTGGTVEGLKGETDT